MVYLRYWFKQAYSKIPVVWNISFKSKCFVLQQWARSRCMCQLENKHNSSCCSWDYLAQGDRPGYVFQLTTSVKNFDINNPPDFWGRLWTTALKTGSYQLLNMPEVPSYTGQRQHFPLVSASLAKCWTYLNCTYGLKNTAWKITRLMGSELAATSHKRTWSCSRQSSAAISSLLSSSKKGNGPQEITVERPD